MVHSLRSIGCASLNLCLVASGGQDMCVNFARHPGAANVSRHWEIGVSEMFGGRLTFQCWPWDVCVSRVAMARPGASADRQAGLCILAEAGGAAFGGKNTSLCGTVNAELLG